MDALSWAFVTRPGDTLTRFGTVLTGSPDALGDQIVKILDQNPFYGHLLREYVYHRLKDSKWKTMEEGASEKHSLPETVKTVHMLGLSGLRDLVLDYHIKRNFGPELRADTKTTLPNTLKIDALTESHRLGYPHHALFAAALFDRVLYALTKTKLAEVKISPNVITQIWGDALKTGTLCYLLGTSLVGFEFQKFCIPSAIFLGAGKLLTLQQAGWNDFFEKIKKQKRPYGLTDLYRERRAFAITHLEQTALLLELNPVFHEITPAILHFYEPHYLKAHPNPNHLKLAHLLRLSQFLVESEGRVDRVPESGWSELEGMGLSKTTALTQIAKWKKDFSA